MAKIIYPAEFPEMFGSMGRHVFSNNKFGPFVREYRKPFDPRTVSQLKIRGSMKFLSQIWNSLSEEEMLTWNNAVKSYGIMSRSKGHKGLLTGNMFFMKANLNLMKIDCDPIRICPFELDLPANLVSVEVWMTSQPAKEEIVIRFAPKLNKSECIVVSATYPLRGRSFSAKNKFRMIGLTDDSLLNGSTQCSILKMYKEKFGCFSDKTRIGFKFQIVDKKTGQASLDYFVEGRSSTNF